MAIQHWNVKPELASELNTLQYADKDFYPNNNVLLRIMHGYNTTESPVVNVRGGQSVC